MISSLDGTQINFFGGRVINVAAEDRDKVEAAIKRSGSTSKLEWTVGVTAGSTYDDFDNAGVGVSLWTLFVEDLEDAQKVQKELDAVA